MDVAEALAHANCSAALSASPAHVAEALQVLAARVVELEAERAEPATRTEWGVQRERRVVPLSEDRARYALDRGLNVKIMRREVGPPRKVGPWREVQAAEPESASDVDRELRESREALAMVEHGADDGPALARYEAALAARNERRAP